MKYIGFFSTISNVEEICSIACKDMKVKVTRETLSDKLKSHPDFPSMSALSNVFSSLGIENAAYKISDIKKIINKGNNCIIQIKNEEIGELFAILYDNASQNSILWYNPIKHKKEDIDINELCQLFTGYILIYAAGDNTGDPNYKYVRKEEIQRNIIYSTLLLFIPIATIFTIIYKICDHTEIIWSQILYTLIMLLGCIFSFALLLYESGAHNPTLSKVCSFTRKTSCTAILSSKASKIFGIPWSVVGMTYFLGSLIAIITNDTTNSTIYTTAAIIQLFTLAYVPFSIYYQGHIAHRWCPLCLAVQLILILLFCISLFGNFFCYVSDISANNIISFIFSFFIIFSSTYFIWLSMRYKRTSDYYRHTLTRQKYNPAVFSALLHKNKKIDFSTDGYGITLGNPNGNIHIIKVCNPYCSHCAAAQPILQHLADNNRNIKLQMIFATNPDSEYYNETPVDLFLSLAQDGADMEQVLSDWYNNEHKDINVFKEKYKLSAKEYSRNKENARLMYEFCKKMEITGTPTIFINGYEMPDIYSINDLQYCLD